MEKDKDKGKNKDIACSKVEIQSEPLDLTYFYYDLGEKMQENVVLPSEQLEPEEALLEEITWDPGTSD